MLRLVVDLSVWIDLFHGRILEPFLELEADVLVSDAQLAEIEKEKGLNLDPYLAQLSTQSYTSSEMTKVQTLITQYPRLSSPDVLAFLLAARANALLVTGDKSLRKLASECGVECHGILWILDTLISRELITTEGAFLSLGSIVEENAFLPKREVRKHLEMWNPHK